VNPSVSILLQKIQPVIVVLLSIVFLRERPRGGFYLWALVAIACGVVLSFPDLNFAFASNALDLRSRGVSYALLAAALWAVSTVAGKALLLGTPPSVATFWRYLFGFLGLGMMLGLSGLSLPWAAASNPATFKSLAYMALVPGLLAMILYYVGLQRTEASRATFAELCFPVAAVAINTYFLGMPLSGVQLAASAGLLGAVTMISLQRR
jgi:drug/metabolite transporter (DMT)-like permease